jgi:plastocyanin domain-containing protein
MKNTFFSIAATLAVATALFSANAPEANAKPTAKAKVQTTRVVIDGAYKPATLSVKAGVPTKLSFTLKSDSGCGNTVVIPSLKKTLDLKVGQTQTVSFTPKKNQTIAFACPMQMFKGKVVAR